MDTTKFYLAIFLFFLSSVGLLAQSTYNYTGAVQTLTTTSDIDAAFHFKLRGGDGGWAKAGDCEASGGDGAITEFRIQFGHEEGDIPPGSSLRLIVGGKGTNQNNSGNNNGARGSGGGGTAILANIDNEWVILGVAGGGGGAYRGTALGFCTDYEPGQGGRSSTSGGDGGGTYGGDGGSNGNGGTGGGDALFGWTDYSGGGGGASSDGTGSNELNGSNHPMGGKKGLNSGGAGGYVDDHNGGWGFGGGGSGDQGGGGGGGYSGGGGGSELDNGGGGGSYINNDYTFNSSITVGGENMNTTDGYIEMTSVCNVVIDGFDYINPLCSEDAQGRIQFDFDYLGSGCDEILQWSLSPLNGWNYLGNGIFRSMRAGDYTLEITNSLLGEVVTSYNFTVDVTDEPPVALCKDITVTLDEDGTYYNPDLEDLMDDGSYHDVCDDGLNMNADHSSFNCDQIGNILVYLTVYSSNGASDYCSSLVTIEPHPDDLPVANCVASLDVDLAGQSSVDITMDDIDNNSIPASCHQSMSLDLTTFTCADVGQIDVTLTISDLADRTDQCTTTVNVFDSGTPVANCMDNFTLVLVNETAVLNPADVNLGSYSGNCTDLTFSTDIVNLTCSDIGTQTVTLTVTDGYNRTNTCTSVLNVTEDNTPVALCTDITVALDENGNYFFDPSEIDNGSHAGCETNLSASVSSFDCEDIGEQTVTLTVTSAEGEQSTCESIVTVLDTIPPVAGSMDLTIELRGTNTIMSRRTQFYQLSSDNCNLGYSNFVGQVNYDCEDVDKEITVYWAAQDLSGNVDTASFIVTLINGAPIIYCNDYNVELEDDGTYSLSDADISNIFEGSDYHCHSLEDFNPTASLVNFDCEDIGNPVEVTMTLHQYGETYSCQSTITVIDDVDPFCNSIKLNPKAFLEGPFDSATGLMNDELRQLNLIPSTSPFAGTSETVSNDVLAITGNDAIVDWVLMELRSAADQSEVLYTQAALLQKDGDIVATNGLSPVQFPDATADNYYIAIRHRNHLGLLTANTYAISATSMSIDFSSGAIAVYGNNSRINLGGKLCLYSADTDGSGAIDATDRSNAWNNRNQNGYLDADCNLDGLINASDRSSTWNNRNISGTLPD